jgi:hypothetical protein
MQHMCYTARWIQTLLNYKKQFGDISFDASAGGNRLNQYAQTTKCKQPVSHNLESFLNNAASPIETFGLHRESINTCTLSRKGYKNFLYLDITALVTTGPVRWQHRSQQTTRHFFYPSVSTSFILSRGELPRWQICVKIRASYAEVGNDTNPTRRRNIPVANASEFPAYFTTQDFYPNANLKPETTSSIERVLTRLLKQRLNVDFTYYNAVTDDQILSLLRYLRI